MLSDWVGTYRATDEGVLPACPAFGILMAEVGAGVSERRDWPTDTDTITEMAAFTLAGETLEWAAVGIRGTAAFT